MSQDEKTLRSFNALLGVHADGATNHRLTEGLREMIATMSNNVIARGGKQKGKIVLSVDLLLDQGTIDVMMDVKMTMPKEGAAKSVYWATEGNQLSQANPKQTEMFSARTGHLKEAESKAV